MKLLNDAYRIVSRVFFALNMLFALCFLIFGLMPNGEEANLFLQLFDAGVIGTVLLLLFFVSACVFSYYALNEPLAALCTPVLLSVVSRFMLSAFSGAAVIAAVIAGNDINYGIGIVCMTTAFELAIPLDGVFAAFALAVHIGRSFAEKREHTPATEE